MTQLLLDLFPDVDLQPTIAIADGRSDVHQCSNCGTLVCRPSGLAMAAVRLGTCPACASNTGWSHQPIGTGPFKPADDLRSWSLWQHVNYHLLEQGKSPQLVRIVIRVGQWVIYRAEHNPTGSEPGKESAVPERMFRDLFPTQVTEEHLQTVIRNGGRVEATHRKAW